MQQHKRGVIVGGMTGALVVSELQTFFRALKANRWLRINHATEYPRIMSLLGLSGREQRPFKDEEIEKVITSYPSVRGYLEDRRLFPVGSIVWGNAHNNVWGDGHIKKSKSNKKI